jgi:hypothetical protein
LIVGITGYAQHGKDTLGQVLVESHRFVRFAFADALKSMALVIDPIVAPYIQEPKGGGYEVVSRRLSTLVADYGWEEAKQYAEVRRFLQVMGTEGVRDHIGEDAWVQATAREIVGAKAERVVITDVRFPNEAAWIFSKGGKLIRIMRTNEDGSPYQNGLGTDHVTEKYVSGLPADYIVSNVSGNIEGFKEIAEELMRRIDG